MQTLRNGQLFAAAFLLLFAAGCGSSTDLGGILGGGGRDTTGTYAREIRGVVDYVDTSNRFVQLSNVTGTSYLSNGGSGSTVRVYYDSDTTVTYQSRNYRPEDLERGDEVAVNVHESGSRIIAESMAVLRDVSGGGSSGGSTPYGSWVRGTVRDVDTRRREIEIDTGSRSAIVQYDSNTSVSFNGRSYGVADLERGDEIEVNVRDLGSGRVLADRVVVTRSVSSGGGSTWGGTDSAVVRGTVRYVDASRRTIELEQTSWVSRFDTGRGTSSIVVVSYDANTPVAYQGRNYTPANLERGDVIEVEVRDTGSANFLARRITVIRDRNAF